MSGTQHLSDPLNGHRPGARALGRWRAAVAPAGPRADLRTLLRHLPVRSTFTPCILTTAVDRTLKIYSIKDHSLLDSHQLTSPILSLAVHPTNPCLVLLATMSGQLSLLDLVSRTTLASVQLHDKYIVKLAISPNGKWAATLGYDKKVVVYEVAQLPAAEGDEPVLLEGEERDELGGTPRVELRVAHERATRTNPEGATFLPGSDHLVYSCRDDHLLHYLSMPDKDGKDGFESTTINLNENGDSWVSFSGKLPPATLPTCL